MRAIEGVGCVLAVMKMIDRSCAAEAEDPSEAEGRRLLLVSRALSSSLSSVARGGAAARGTASAPPAD